ncbi:hypothetical protein ScPMuIL_006830 [Solemya velum]
MPLLPVLKFVTLKFGVYYEACTSSRHVRLGLVGSLPELGGWDIRKCVLAMESQDHPDCWIAVVRVPENCEFQWKWVVMSADKSLVFRWEDTIHSMKSGTTSGRLRTWWNGDVNFFPGLRSDCQSRMVRERTRSMPVKTYKVMPDNTMMGMLGNVVAEMLEILQIICQFFFVIGSAMLVGIQNENNQY